MDTDEHLRQHDEQLTHLVALNVKVVDAIERIDASIERLDASIEGINQSLAIVTQLLHCQREDDHRNGQ